MCVMGHCIFLCSGCLNGAFNAFVSMVTKLQVIYGYNNVSSSLDLSYKIIRVSGKIIHKILPKVTSWKYSRSSLEGSVPPVKNVSAIHPFS